MRKELFEEKLAAGAILQIQVTQSNIDNGDQNETVSCAIAKAFSREFKGCDPMVCGDEVEMSLNGKDYFLEPLQARQHEDFVEAFDDKKSSVKPQQFSYRVKVTDETQELG